MADLFRHIKLSGPNNEFNFTSVKSGSKPKLLPSRNREQHGNYIQQRLEQAWQESENEFLVAHSERSGVYLEFVSSPGFELTINSLEGLRQGIRLCNVKQERQPAEQGESEVTYATVFIPTDFLKFKLYKEQEVLYMPANKSHTQILEI